MKSVGAKGGEGAMVVLFCKKLYAVFVFIREMIEPVMAIGPLQLGSRDQILPRKFLYYEL